MKRMATSIRWTCTLEHMAPKADNGKALSDLKSEGLQIRKVATILFIFFFSEVFCSNFLVEYKLNIELSLDALLSCSMRVLVQMHSSGFQGS